MNFENWWRNKYDEVRGTPEFSESNFQLMRDAWQESAKAARKTCAEKVLILADEFDKRGLEGAQLISGCAKKILDNKENKTLDLLAFVKQNRRRK